MGGMTEAIERIVDKAVIELPVCAENSANDISQKIDYSVAVLSPEQLKNSGIKTSRLIFNNYVKDLGRSAESIYLGTQRQVNIAALPEYEKVILAIAELKKTAMKLVSQYEPKIETHYSVRDGQLNGHH